MSPETLIVFFSASIALGLAPGPDNLFVLAQAAQHGVRAGLLVTIGLCTGLVFHTALVAFGVAVIFQTSPVAITALKVIGACYLLYLAVQAFRPGASRGEAAMLSQTKLYLRGIIMNITNPKVAIFFLAFLPQFVEPDTGELPLQIAQLGLLFILATLLIFGAVALLAGYLSGWLRTSSRAQQALNYLAGTVFVALAVRLVLVQN